MITEATRDATEAPLRLAILGDPNGSYVCQLLNTAQAMGIAAECLTYNQLRAETTVSACGPGSVAASLRGFDAVIVRSMPLGSLEQVIFRMDCLQLAQDCGTLVINPPRCLEVAIDKWLTLHRLAMAGIPVPATIVCQERDDALAAFESLGRDVVVKPLFGSEGRGMLRVQDADLAWRVFSTLQQLRCVHYVQQYQEHFGYDIRVLLIGQQHYAVRRLANAGNWRTNVSQGSRAEEHTLSDHQLALARMAARAVAGQWSEQSIFGVDLLPCRDGQTRVLEVNAVPGWRGLGGALQLDVAREILVFVENLVRRCRLSSNPRNC